MKRSLVEPDNLTLSAPFLKFMMEVCLREITSSWNCWRNPGNRYCLYSKIPRTETLNTARINPLYTSLFLHVWSKSLLICKVLLLGVTETVLRSKRTAFPDLHVMLLCRNQDVFGDIPPNYWLDPIMFGLEEPHHGAAELQFYSSFPGSIQTFTVRGTVPPMTFMLLRKRHPS